MTSIGEANTEIISELNSSLARVKFGKVNVMPSRESTAVSDDELQDQETAVLDESEPTMRGVYMPSCLACSMSEVFNSVICSTCNATHTYIYTHYLNPTSDQYNSMPLMSE